MQVQYQDDASPNCFCGCVIKKSVLCYGSLPWFGVHYSVLLIVHGLSDEVTQHNVKENLGLI